MNLQRILDIFRRKSRPDTGSRKVTPEEHRFMCLFPGIQCWLANACYENKLPLTSIDRTEFSVVVDTGKSVYEIPRDEILDVVNGSSFVALQERILTLHRAAL